MFRNASSPSLSTCIAGDRPGYGMLAVLLVMLVAGAIASAAALLGTNTLLVNAYAQREATLQAVADDGLEQARAKLNGNKVLYNDTAYSVLENKAPVKDVSGNTIPGVTRTTWVGPGGIATGQFGVFGEIVVQVDDGDRNRVVRRAAINQESFAKFAYFTNIEGAIVFGGGDRIQGPVHSNDVIQIDNSHATFEGTIETAKTITGKSYGTFMQGYKERAPVIAMPLTADLNKLKGYAQSGNTYFKPQNNPAGQGQARMRIEFLTVDMNSNGRVDDDEAFIRVYTSPDEEWVVAGMPSGNNTMKNTRNCGGVFGGGFRITTTLRKSNSSYNADSSSQSLVPPKTHCGLGGDTVLTRGFKATTTGGGSDSVPNGSWVKYTDTPDVRLTALGRADAMYLFPINHAGNANFKGVIFVEGKVAISGVVHGHVTLASTDNIVIADDITYAYAPGVGGCQDLLGLFTAKQVVIADNILNTPQVPNTRWSQTNRLFTYGATADESIDAVILALDQFTGENYDSGPSSGQPCEGTTVGRGCLYLTGGVIQNTRGAVGTTGGTGYIKRYSYDTCAAVIPPPYFPTTGHFNRGQYFEVNASGFDIGRYTSNLMARH